MELAQVQVLVEQSCPFPAYLRGHLDTTQDLLKSRMRENRTYGSVRGGGSNADRLLDIDQKRSVVQ